MKENNSEMPDPTVVLQSLQQALDEGMRVEPSDLDEDYMTFHDNVGGPRFSYAKIIGREVQALSIFGLDEPINGIPCFSVGYAVKTKYRGRGLGVECVTKGIKELITGFSRTPMISFYVDAIINIENTSSLNVARKIFSEPGTNAKDYYTGTPCLYFNKLILLR